MDSQTYNFIKYVLEIDSNEIIKDIDTIKDIIMNKFEGITGCKIYNKSTIISKIDNINMHDIKILINHNMIPEISFNTMFKSNLQFTFVFKENEILVLYKNIKVELQKLTDIKTDLLTNEIKFLPIIPEIFVNNIINVIEKLIKKDISVKYHLTDFPVPYWNLFQIKCKKSNPNILKELDKYKYLEDIINGNNYKTINKPESNEKEDTELETFIQQIKEMEDNQPIDTESKELNEFYRMEIMSYLNDTDIIYFLEKMEIIDKTEKTMSSTVNVNNHAVNYIKLLLDIISDTSNKMIKYYVVYKIFSFILKLKDFLIINTKFRVILINKIIELQSDIYIIQSAGLEFSKEFANTIEKCKVFIDDIEKSLDSNYVSKWV